MVLSPNVLDISASNELTIGTAPDAVKWPQARSL